MAIRSCGCLERGRLRAARHSSKRCTTQNIDGTKSTARQVEASIPLNTVMPIDLRALAPAPLCDDKRRDPEDERERGHENCPEARPGRIHRCREDRTAFDEAPLARNLDDQDGILRRKRNKQNHADLRIEIVVNVKN
jgi:hypothetical protein